MCSIPFFPLRLVHLCSVFLYGVGTLVGIFSAESVLSSICPCHATKGVFEGVAWDKHALLLRISFPHTSYDFCSRLRWRVIATMSNAMSILITPTQASCVTASQRRARPPTAA